MSIMKAEDIPGMLAYSFQVCDCVVRGLLMFEGDNVLVHDEPDLKAIVP